MMNIRLAGIGKRFGSEWIFRRVDAEIASGESWAILGRNGSGKSTLLQILCGNLTPTSGTITWSLNGKPVGVDNIYRYIALAAPYQELIEEFSLREMIRFHFAFKKPRIKNIPGDIISLLGFRDTGDKPIRQFSSGMKQRVKLILAVMSEAPLLLLDEPAMSLDNAGIEWYHSLIRDHGSGRTIVICSNLRQTEAAFVNRTINIEDFRDRR